MNSSRLPAPFEPIDVRITAALARAGVPVLRIGLGVVFLWFGALKFFPGASPAEMLAARTIEQLSGGSIGPSVSMPGLATWESLIGLGLLTGRLMRATLLLLVVQMLGTMTPLVLFPAETFTTFPFAPTLEGQYIIKNVVLIGAAMVVGATVRGGGLVADPAAAQLGTTRDRAATSDPAAAPPA
ncbi:MAG: DoxX family membrane protein [Chloroflexi bacterium]|nr:DoxX family membrane protein [Chloroflexota bacterium]